jgi:serine/threonine protein kinase/Tfp pilus assembly protein PilF
MNGKLVSHYRILQELGGGGMGVVYKAEDTKLGRFVALKFLADELSKDRRAVERFRQEARAASALAHPNICTIHDIDEQDGRQFIVMELLEGQTLKECCAGRPMQPWQVTKLGMQVAEALHAAHAKGIIHRDIKPANIFVNPRCQAKLLDFGLAKLQGPVSEATLTQSLTAPHALAGTLPYMSPEQLRGEPADARSDIWALGVVLYEMAAGKRPFRQEPVTRLISDISHLAPPPPSRMNPDLPPKLDDVILKCLDKDPENRYQSAKELEVDLRRLEAPAPAEPVEQQLPSKRMYALLAVGLAAIVAVGILIGSRLGGGRDPWSGANPNAIRSLAVLPLKNISGDHDQDYFAGGMTEQLTTDLAQLGAVRVTSIVSVMRYRNTEKPLPDIARELNVDAVVSGAVFRSGSRVRISAQLIRAHTDQTLWAASYDRDLQDILNLQSEVTEAIAHEVQIRLSRQAERELKRTRKVNPRAYQAYLQGVYGTTSSPMGMGLDSFREAIEIDPDYAPPYAALARAEYFQGLFGSLRPSRAFPDIRDLAQKAMARDTSMADAFGWRALVETHYDWNWSQAKEDFQHALALNPNQADIHHDYAHYLLAMNRPEESLAETQRAEELDPFNPMLVACVGWHSLFARQYDQARDHALKALKLESENPWAYLVLGWSEEQKQMYPEAVEAFRKAVSASMGFPIASSSLAHALAVSGKRAEAQKQLAEMLTQAKEGYFPAYDIAIVYAGLGDADRAFEWLDKASREHSAFLIHANWDPRLTSLHSDSRFAELIRGLNLPQ